MIIGIHPDRNRSTQQSYSEKWADILRSRGIEVCMLDLLACDAMDQARRCDGVMWRWKHTPQDKQSAKKILYTIEHCLNIPVFPDSRSSWHYDEKVSQHYLFQALEDVPTCNTWVFWNEQNALEWALTAPYPLVFKLSSGAGSANVVKIADYKKAEQLIKRCFGPGLFPYSMNEFAHKFEMPKSMRDVHVMIRRFVDAMKYFTSKYYPPLPPAWKPEHGYVYFQEFLPDNEFDTRITVIGNRAFAYRRFNRPGDFRASGSGNFSVDPENIDKRCVEIAHKISRRGEFTSIAYDFIFKNKEPVITEISYTFVDWMVHDCPGYWAPDLRWVPGQMWPQEAQVDDFLQRISRFQSDDINDTTQLQP